MIDLGKMLCGRLAVSLVSATMVVSTIGITGFAPAAAGARDIRHGAKTSVSREGPRRGGHGVSDRERRPLRSDARGYPGHVDNWGSGRHSHNRPSDKPDHHRPPPRGVGDGGYYYGSGGYYRHGHDRYWRDRDDDDFWEFLGAASLVAAGVALIGAATDSPPSGSCSEREVDGNTYLQCDDRWYARIRENDSVKYQQIQRPF